MAEEKPKGEGEGEGKGGEGEGKGGIPQARLDAEVARRKKAEQELEALKKTQDEGAKKALEEQKKFEELYNGAKPKAELADVLQKAVGDYLAEETKDLTDEHKALIPEGAPHVQLSWVKKAKAAGVFGKQDSPDNTFNGKPKSKLPPEKWFLELKSDDPRFEKLSTQQYKEWKAHNGVGGAVTVAGGF